MAEQSAFEEFKAEFAKMAYDTYRVEIDLHDVAGGTPATPEMIKGWVESKCKAMTAESREAIKNATVEEMPAITDDAEQSAWCRFKQDADGVYLEGRQLKAALKESANIIKSLVKGKGDDGTKALKSKVAECVFVVDEKIYITRDGKKITGEIPAEERPVHVMTRQGPRTSIKKSDVLRDVSIVFTVRLTKTKAVTEEALFSALAYLQNLGIGADRSQGRGRAKDIRVAKI